MMSITLLFIRALAAAIELALELADAHHVLGLGLHDAEVRRCHLALSVAPFGGHSFPAALVGSFQMVSEITFATDLLATSCFGPTWTGKISDSACGVRHAKMRSAHADLSSDRAATQASRHRQDAVASRQSQVSKPASSVLWGVLFGIPNSATITI